MKGLYWNCLYAEPYAKSYSESNSDSDANSESHTHLVLNVLRRSFRPPLLRH